MRAERHSGPARNSQVPSKTCRRRRQRQRGGDSENGRVLNAPASWSVWLVPSHCGLRSKAILEKRGKMQAVPLRRFSAGWNVLEGNGSNPATIKQSPCQKCTAPTLKHKFQMFSWWYSNLREKQPSLSFPAVIQVSLGGFASCISPTLLASILVRCCNPTSTCMQ